jgi:UDP-N-acetylmuramate dehydrogenase
VFKNPPGDSAGRLIERAGLKGRQVGGAVISPVHANYIVNTGGATAADILTLIDLARSEVLRQFHVALELEVCVL